MHYKSVLWYDRSVDRVPGLPELYSCMNLQPDKKPLPKTGLAAEGGELQPPQPSKILISLTERPVLVAHERGLQVGVDSPLFTLDRLIKDVDKDGKPIFSRILFRTGTGNAYSIQRLESGRWTIFNAHRSLKAYLPDTTVWDGKVEVGKRFQYGGRHTAHVMQVVALKGGGARPENFDLDTVRRAGLRLSGGEVSFFPSFLEKHHRFLSGNPLLKKETFSRIKRPLAVLNHNDVSVGSECVAVKLAEFAATGCHADAPIRQVFFRTASGNLYGLISNVKRELLLLNSRDGDVKRFSAEEAKLPVLAFSQRFSVGRSIATSPVERIVTVSSKRCPLDAFTIEGIRDRAIEVSHGNLSLVKIEFVEAMIKLKGEAGLREILRQR